MKLVTLLAASLLLATAAAQAGSQKDCSPSDLLPDIKVPQGLTAAVGAIMPTTTAAPGTPPAVGAAPAAAAPAASGKGVAPQQRISELEDIVRKQNQLIDLQNKRISELESRR